METATSQVPGAELSKENTRIIENEMKNSFPANEASSNRREMTPLKKAKELLASSNVKLSEQMQGLKVILGVTISSGLIVTIALIVSIYQGDPEVLPHGGCSTATPHCSAICIDTLKKGGNAVDASIAATFCLGVVNPHHSGIGGGGFMLVHNHKTMENTAFDFRETAPRAANPSLYEHNPKLSIKGPYSVAVPGEIKGMEAAHKAFGQLSWSDLVMPAVKLARHGFVASESFVKNMEMVQDGNAEFLASFFPNGKIPSVGEIIYRKDLANALETIANEGADAFYNGSLSEEIVKATKKFISLEDLREYSVIKRDTVSTTYGDHAVLSIAPPSGGVVLLSILNILNGYHFGPADQYSAKTYFKLIEAFKHAYAQRGSLGDPSDREFREKIMNSTNYFLSHEAAKTIREKINSMNYTSDYNISRYLPSSVFREDKGTAHVSVIDNDELMVSVTTTINTWFGSHLLTKSGILLNNEMDDFSTSKHLNFFDIPPSQVNDIKPGKRPQSSVAPAIVHSLSAPCDLRLTIGGTNGSKIPSGIAEVLINILSFKMDLQTATTVPRLHNQLFTNMTEYETNFNATIVKALSRMGQNMVKQKKPINIVQFVAKNYSDITAISDHRKGNYSTVY
ncbi:glutathione hydrolase 1 proenzyme isoform X2 [Octopus bimaculoides]|uniref:Gamma-glutamyltransferase n=1 Tax=Octopus bimaculoides TaxID=37653 RepID=A0A0L8FZH4_OCTBM|nr:glutathione hydrolase 1 proenzyme isoform X2 [Octopus bimaculoides]|eukprot:XP_014785501.1 PREDICTED: gamma-glutamyltranspeptidase 1-like [Octopus bimaculoides]